MKTIELNEQEQNYLEDFLRLELADENLSNTFRAIITNIINKLQNES